jgi:energy-coupling factor transporter ATPase
MRRTSAADVKPPFIRVERLHHRYEGGRVSADVKQDYSLRNVSFEIGTGEYVSIIGANGSGKSTLLRHMNALLLPVSGDVWVHGWNTREVSSHRDIRSRVGMVFQSPEAQIVATVVEEDIAFGPENLGVPRKELRERVDWSLERVGLIELRKRPVEFLSAGQKQLLAIASALSMKPECLLLDEATSSLDPSSRMQFLETIESLHAEGLTILSTTHRMDEAVLGERVIVLSEGSIFADGDPRSVFKDIENRDDLGLDSPEALLMARRIALVVPGFRSDALTPSELVNAVTEFIDSSGQRT